MQINCLAAAACQSLWVRSLLASNQMWCVAAADRHRRRWLLLRLQAKRAVAALLGYLQHHGCDMNHFSEPQALQGTVETEPTWVVRQGGGGRVLSWLDLCRMMRSANRI